MDFTGLHINILARHTLNKNPSYAIANGKERQWIFHGFKILLLNNIGEDLFKCLNLNYDVLPNQLKKCFRLCSLWPEDKNIPKDTIIQQCTLF